MQEAIKRKVRKITQQIEGLRVNFETDKITVSKTFEFCKNLTVYDAVIEIMNLNLELSKIDGIYWDHISLPEFISCLADSIEYSIVYHLEPF